MNAPEARWRRAARLVAGNALAVVLLLALVEGLSSMGLFTADLLLTSGVAERHHTTFDPELGWINLPGLAIPDMYGPGRHLHTNSRRFRGLREVEPEVPTGKRRIICAGDSFTLGYGVDDRATWCAALSEIDDRLETVNMGQGGYGLDQAYLWYRRDAAPLRHQVLVLALVVYDFDRMRMDRISGYPKPRLALAGAGVTVTNLPLPEPSRLGLWLSSRWGATRRLRVAEVARRARSGGEAVPLTAPPEPPDAEHQALVAALLADAKRLCVERSSRLVLLLLPTLTHEGRERHWEALLEREARALQVPFIDLVLELRRVPVRQQPRLFIGDGEVPYRGATGHLNEAGNAWVAEALHRRLMAEPDIAAALGGPR